MSTESMTPEGAERDLATRLREAGDEWLGLGDDENGGLVKAAAERIEALEAENARLRVEVGRLNEIIDRRQASGDASGYYKGHP